MNDELEARRRYQIAGAKRYAAFDRSDPFALKRALMHIRNGLAEPKTDGSDAMYDVEEHITYNGQHVVIEHRNITRV